MEVTACLENIKIDVEHEGKCTGPQLPLETEANIAEESDPCEGTDPPPKCNLNYDPVCGTDGKTYSNQCNLNQSSYDSLCNPQPGDVGRPIYVAYGGPCVVVPIRSNDACDVCQRIFRPVCASDGRTYTNACEMKAENCRKGVEPPVFEKFGSCQDGDIVFRETNSGDVECGKKCSKIYRPICASNGVQNITFNNECMMKQESCTARQEIRKVGEGACDAFHPNMTDEGSDDHDVTIHLERSGCPNFCTFQYDPVCGSDGNTYGNRCQLEAEICRNNHNLKVAHAGECGTENCDVEKAAEFGTSQLAAKLGSENHFTLAYIESAETQVVSGHNYILTILVGASNCPVEQAYDKDACQIVNPDASLRCDIVVFKPLQSNGDNLQLTKHVCDKAFDFQNICIGCPIDGTPEAEAAYTVAEYIVRDLTSKAAKAHVIQNHLGLDNIKKFMKDSDGKGGFFYTVDLTVSESNCNLDEPYDPQVCAGNKRDSRLCSAKVIESGPSQKLPRGVEIRRYEVTSTLCKDPHDVINLERQATVEDVDVIDVAKAITNQVGETFGENVWLITQVISASRQKAEEGLNYALSLKFAESDCPRANVGNAEPDLLYGGVCTVDHTAKSKTCQVLVNKRKNTYRSIGATFQISILDQVCAERKVCPTDCAKYEVSPVCGSDGKTYPSTCYMQQASCQKSSKSEITPAPDAFCAKTALQDSIICAGCPQEGSRENEDVRAAADFATLVLTSEFDNKHYFALDSITQVKTQVVAGTNFFLTLIIGESDCEVGDIESADQEFDKEQCTINLEHDNNYMCEVVVYKPLKALGDNLILSQKNCRKVEVSKHVKLNCNMKCKKFYDPVCGTNGQTFLNDCLLKMASCINQDQVTRMAAGRCELEASEVTEEAEFAVRTLSDRFKNQNRWALKDVLSGSKIQNGVRVTLRVQETDCLKTARSDAPCDVKGPSRRCEITVNNSTRGLKVKKEECNADVVTLCDTCPEDSLEIAKYAVKEITEDFEESNEWALQHIDKAKSKVIKGKYVIYNLSLHMTETSCSRGTPGVYSENCLLRASAPSNYCEVFQI